MDEVEDRQPKTNQNDKLPQGITKKSLEPIFSESDLLSLQEAYEIALSNGLEPQKNQKKAPLERFRQLFRKEGDIRYGIQKVKDHDGKSVKYRVVT